MPFPPSFLDDVVARNPIEDVVGQYVTLQRRGATSLVCAPSMGRRRPPSPLRRIREFTTALVATREAG